MALLKVLSWVAMHFLPPSIALHSVHTHFYASASLLHELISLLIAEVPSLLHSWDLKTEQITS